EQPPDFAGTMVAAARRDLFLRCRRLGHQASRARLRALHELERLFPGNDESITLTNLAVFFDGALKEIQPKLRLGGNLITLLDKTCRDAICETVSHGAMSGLEFASLDDPDSAARRWI